MLMDILQQSGCEIIDGDPTVEIPAEVQTWLRHYAKYAAPVILPDGERVVVFGILDNNGANQ